MDTAGFRQQKLLKNTTAEHTRTRIVLPRLLLFIVLDGHGLISGILYAPTLLPKSRRLFPVTSTSFINPTS